SLAETGNSDLPCLILGYDTYGNLDVGGAYVISLGRWLILDENTVFDEVFVMSSTTSSRMDGVYYQSYSDGTNSDEYAAVATRTETIPSLTTQASSNVGAESAEENAKEMALSEMSVMDTLKAKGVSTVSKQVDDPREAPDLNALVERLRELTRTAVH